jgi:hypothetical protein
LYFGGKGNQLKFINGVDCYPPFKIFKMTRRARGQLDYESLKGWETRIDYNGGTNPIYVGKAEEGSATSAAVWQIKKLTWDANDNPTRIQFASDKDSFTAIWDNRAALF